MGQNFTRMISLNRDNIVQMTTQPDFFTRNPGLESLQQQLTDCREAFNVSAKKAGCRCRADTTLLAGCVSNFLETLEAAKQTAPEVVQQFVQYAAKTDNITGTGVTIFYAKPNETTPTRYLFP
jgi:hypothetical protein